MTRITAPLAGYVLVGLIFLSCISAHEASSQTFNTNSNAPSYILTPMDNVRNTGNDSYTSAAGGWLHVMVADGDDPGFQYEDEGYSTTGSFDLVSDANSVSGNPTTDIRDPDIVIEHSSRNVFIIYETFDGTDWRIGYSQYDYSLGNYTFNTAGWLAPTQGRPNCPNVDATQISSSILTSKVVVTWQEFGYIVAGEIDLSGATPSFPNQFYGFTPPPVGGVIYSNPDVAVYARDDASNFVVTLVYTSSVSQIIFAQPSVMGTYSSIDAALQDMFNSQGLLPGFRAMPFPGTSVGPPRVAMKSPASWIDFDFWVVISAATGPGSQIISYSTNTLVPFPTQSPFPTITVMNAALSGPPLFGCPNSEPVVTYIGDNVLVAWTYDDGSCGVLPTGGTNTVEVIGRAYVWNAQPQDDNYRILDDGMTGTQNNPSISGRWAVGHMHSCYISTESSTTYFAYKASPPAYTTWKSEENPASNDLWQQSLIYPNPFSQHTNICREDGSFTDYIEVYDALGILAKRIKPPVAGECLIWDGTDEDGTPVPSGIYVIRVQGSQAFVIQKASE